MSKEDKMEVGSGTGASRSSIDVQCLPATASAAMPRILFGLRLWASVCLALLVAYWLQLDDAYWAGTSASIVAQPGLGASLRKGRFRAIGTVLGAVVIVLLTAVFPQNHLAFLLSLTLWGAICGFVATILPNFAGYAAALAGYTAAVVFAAVVDNPGDVFLVSVTRAVEISIGIFAAGLVHALTDFGDARRRLQYALANIGREIAVGLSRTLAAEAQLLEMRTARRQLIRRVTDLGATIDEAIGEPSHLRSRSGGLQAAMEALFTALSAWRGVANHLLSTAVSAPGRAACAALLPVIAKVSQADWLSDPLAVRDLCGIEARRVLQLPATDLSARLLVDSCAQALHALERAANGLVLVVKPGSERPDAGASWLHVPDILPAVLNGLRVVMALFAAELFWIATAWPGGPTMITFTAVGVILFSPREDAAYPSVVEYAVGTAVAGGLAAILSLAILPSLHGGFISLSLALACVLLPLGAMSAGPRHKLAFMAMVTNLLPILSIENQPSYDSERLFNAILAISAGMVVAAIFMRLLPPVAPAMRIQRLLHLTLRDLRRVAGRRQRLEKGDWISVVSQRLAVMPKQATLDQEAELLAGLSVGEASIGLLEARPHLPGSDALDHAFACLGVANVAETLEWLARFCLQQPVGAAAETQRGMQAAVQATLIADALTRHGSFFASVA
jgi:uncharacterized membrane protein YccC